VEALPSHHILYPVFAMVALVAFVLNRMRSMRFAAVRSGEIGAGFFRAYEGEEPEALRVVSRHFTNLFEMPVLFYVAVLMTYVTGQVTLILVALAWLYVALRYAHSFVHLGSNGLIQRFTVYIASAVVLFVMYAALLVQLVLTGGS
jgi:hypothetical protein